MACEDETDDCKMHRENYFNAAFDWATAVGEINALMSHSQWAAGATAGGSLLGVTAWTGPPGWAVAGFVAAAGGLVSFIALQVALSRARERCQDAVMRLHASYAAAQIACSPDCVPPPPDPAQTCP